MSDALEVAVADGFSPNLDTAIAGFRGELLSVAGVLNDELLAQVRALASGVVLKLHSGRYRESFYGAVKASEDGVAAYVASRAPEAGILEFGGETSAHDILPSVAQALRFEGGAGAVYASVIHDPGARIGAHPVLRPALDALADEILTRFGAAALALAADLS